MDLQSKLIQGVMQEAGRRIATIDRNRGLIAETAAMAEALNSTTPGDCFVAFVCVHEESVTAAVHARWITPGAVRQAIRAAGLEIAREEIADGSNYLHLGDIQFFLAGMDVPVALQNPAEELRAA